MKLNFAKNDMSDLYAFGATTNPIIQNCIAGDTGISATLVTDSFSVDTVNNTWGFSLNVTVPISFKDTDAATCIEAFGGQAMWNLFQETGRQNINLILKTVFVRPSTTTVDGTYVPMPLGEKDPIQRKYGPLKVIVPYRDQTTQLLGAQTFVNRFNPMKPITFYFAPGMPDVYKDFFVNTVQPMTNSAVFANTGGTLGNKTLQLSSTTTTPPPSATAPAPCASTATRATTSSTGTRISTTARSSSA